MSEMENQTITLKQLSISLIRERQIRDNENILREARGEPQLCGGFCPKGIIAHFYRKWKIDGNMKMTELEMVELIPRLETDNLEEQWNEFWDFWTKREHYLINIKNYEEIIARWRVELEKQLEE